MVAAAPEVQVTVSVAVPFKADEWFAVIGSYAPKLSEPALMVQLFETDALTLISLLAVPANADTHPRVPTARTPNPNRLSKPDVINIERK
jgi:hypothetical protein